jgi:ABC-type Fe3+-siderophore transport system, permease component
MVGLLVVLVANVMLAANTGQYPIQINETIGYFTWILGLNESAPEQTISLVLTEIRLPRVIASILVGGALAAAGCVYQVCLEILWYHPIFLGSQPEPGSEPRLGYCCHSQLLRFNCLHSSAD